LCGTQRNLLSTLNSTISKDRKSITRKRKLIEKDDPASEEQIALLTAAVNGAIETFEELPVPTAEIRGVLDVLDGVDGPTLKKALAALTGLAGEKGKLAKVDNPKINGLVTALQRVEKWSASIGGSQTNLQDGIDQVTKILGEGGIATKDSATILKCIESLGAAVGGIESLAGSVASFNDCRTDQGKVLDELKATAAATSVLHSQLCDTLAQDGRTGQAQVKESAEQSARMAAQSARLAARMEQSIEQNNKVTGLLSQQLRVQEDSMIKQHIEIVHLGVERSIAKHAREQKDQFNDLQIQQMKHHAEFVNQLRIGESRKRPYDDGDANYPHRRRDPYAAPREQHGLYDNRDHNQQGNGVRDVRPPPPVQPLSAQGWKNWSREDVRGWIIQIGCPLLAAALFPSVGSPAPPIAVSGGLHLQHLNKFLENIGADSVGEKF
jgi:hypothetical protein